MMTDRAKTSLFVACVFVFAVAVLSVLGLAIGSAWSTFIPDLLVGVITAGGIAGAIAWIQARSDHRRAQDEAITRAYEGLLDSLGDLQLADLTRRDTGTLMSRAGVKMINYVERLESEDGPYTLWFEAHRRYMRHLVLECVMSFSSGDDLETKERKCAPFRRHIQNFVANLRRGRMVDISGDLQKEAADMERTLRAAGRWDDAATGV